MKTKSSQSAFFNLRVLIASVFCVTAVFIALGAARLYSAPAKAQPTTNSPGGPKVTRMIGPVVKPAVHSGKWSGRRTSADATSVSVGRGTGKIGRLCLPAFPIADGKGGSPYAKHAAAATRICWNRSAGERLRHVWRRANHLFHQRLEM